MWWLCLHIITIDQDKRSPKFESTCIKEKIFFEIKCKIRKAVWFYKPERGVQGELTQDFKEQHVGSTLIISEVAKPVDTGTYTWYGTDDEGE